MGSRRRTSTAAVAMTLALAACTATPPNVATYDSGGAGMDALLSGTLRITEACVTVEVEDGVTVPVFPRGDVAVTDEGLELHGRTYADGSRVELGGGETASGKGFSVPDDCPTGRYWVVAPR